MSVPVSKRAKGKLEVFTLINNLVQYTEQKVQNKNYFSFALNQVVDEKIVPNNLKPVLAKNIYSETLAIKNYANRANKVYVKTSADYTLRREFQNKAITEISALRKDIERAMIVCNIPGKEIYYWEGLLHTIEELLRNWRNEEYIKYMG